MHLKLFSYSLSTNTDLLHVTPLKYFKPSNAWNNNLKTVLKLIYVQKGPCCCCCYCCYVASVVSDSVRPHRRQPTRLPCPWDSAGKNTGVGCHFLLQCMKVKSESESEVVSDSSRSHGLQPTRLLHPWDFPGKSTGVGCHCLLR